MLSNMKQRLLLPAWEPASPRATPPPKTVLADEGLAFTSKNSMVDPSALPKIILPTRSLSLTSENSMVDLKTTSCAISLSLIWEASESQTTSVVVGKQSLVEEASNPHLLPHLSFFS